MKTGYHLYQRSSVVSSIHWLKRVAKLTNSLRLAFFFFSTCHFERPGDNVLLFNSGKLYKVRSGTHFRGNFPVYWKRKYLASSKGATTVQTNQKAGFRSRGTNGPISVQQKVMWPVNQIFMSNACQWRHRGHDILGLWSWHHRGVDMTS